MTTAANQVPVAVIGISCIFPGSPKVEDFWRHILRRTDLISEVPKTHWLHEDYSSPDHRVKIPHSRGGFVPFVDFDPLAFSIPPKLLASTDTVQLLALLAAKELTENLSCLRDGKVSLQDVSCMLGVAAGTELLGQMSSKIQRGNWIHALRESGISEPKAKEICDRIEDTYSEWTENTFPGLLGNVVSGRIANRFDLGGTNCTFDAACASSLAAVTMAIQELQLGNSRLVITGGADAVNDPGMFMCFSQSHALSPSGDCRPFDTNGDGTLLGEGIGFVALKRLEDAEADGDPIYAVIKGYGSSSDGRSKSVYAPRASGQASAIRRAYDKAGYDLSTVELIEGHGTATVAGDIAEYEGLVEVFQECGRHDKQWCALGSVKSQIGHTKSSAGAASLIKIALSLHHKVLPPTIKVTQPNPKFDIANGPLYLNTETRPWIANDEYPRRAALSSLGFGGTNFHLTLEEYSGPSAKPAFIPQANTALLLFSAATVSGLRTALAESRARLETAPLIVVAKHTQQTYQHDAAVRLAIVVSGSDSAADLMIRAEQRLTTETGDWCTPGSTYFSTHKRRGKLAFIFPGQGSQYVNMGSELLTAFPRAREAWEGANTVLDQPLQSTVFPIPVWTQEDRVEQEARLRRTDRAQPALGATSLAFLALLNELGLKPDAVAGHSYGELIALYCAGSIPSAEALMQISAIRGSLMAEQADSSSCEGAMTAVFASRAAVEDLLVSAEGVVIANDNSPEQTVIAGPTDEILATEQRLDRARITYRRLPVATAFHTEQIAGAETDFAAHLNDFEWGQAKIPVYSNKTGGTYPEGFAPQKSLLANQLASPVRFREMIDSMAEGGVTTFLEVGPGSVLSGLVQSCLKGTDAQAIAMDSKQKSSTDAFWSTLGQLSVLGYELDYANLWRPFTIEDRPAPELSTATVKINGSNHDKPYPPKGGRSVLPPPVRDMPASLPEGGPRDQDNSAVKERHTEEAMTTNNGSASTRQPSAPQSELHAFHQALSMVQMQYQQAMTQSHLEFLRTSTQTLQSLNGEVAIDSPELPSPHLTPPLTPSHHNAAWQDSLTISPRPNQGLAAQTPDHAPGVSMRSLELPATHPNGRLSQATTTPPAQRTPAQAPPAQTTPVQAPPPEVISSSRGDFSSMLIQVTADKTGYPADMLELDAHLEADLGIDSIKRVEILAELQQRFPELADVDTGKLSSMQSMSEILDLYNEHSGSSEVAAADPFA